MKIAAACEGKNISPHFGHCEHFEFYTAENNEIKGTERIETPPHKHGFLPGYLKDHGANAVITGGIGAGAIELFNEANIEVISGASGNADEAVKAYLAGNLKSGESVCHEHEFKDSCGGHED